MEDKLIDQWRKEFEEWHSKNHAFTGDLVTCMGVYIHKKVEIKWQTWLAAKRSQPVVELPKPDSVDVSFNFGDFISRTNVYDADEIHALLQSAGIPFKVRGE